ncbi:MAG: DNA repair protein RadC [Campylobacterota bacterium]|nr:DNA repair protein RadC [Campylobacterota bacterium]
MKTIDELNNFDKPREKLLKKGVESLKEYELLAIVLGSGTKDKDVLKLSREIIKLFEEDFENISLEKLTTIHGLGQAKSAQILSAIELSKRYLIKQNRKITNAEDIYQELQEYKNKLQEYFIVVTLNGANHIIQKRVVFIGTLNSSLVHPREVFADALSDRAASIIIAHNHPSGELNASTQDLLITKRLHESAKLLGIELLDHIIFTKDGYLSMKDEELF